MTAVEFVLWIFCAGLGLAIAAGIWAFVREKILRKQPGSLRLVDHHPCFLGSPGIGISIRVRREGETIVVKTARSYYGFLLLATFLFGPGVTGLYLTTPEKFGAPLPIGIMVGMLSALASLAFLQTCWTVAFRLPSIEADWKGVEFKRGGQLVAKILRQDLVALDEELTVYRSKRHENPNYGLVAVTKAGDRQSLWIVSDRARHDEASGLLRRTLELPDEAADKASVLREEPSGRAPLTF